MPTRLFVLRLLLVFAILMPANAPIAQAIAVANQIGDGSPQSCTEEALDLALAAGGIWTFECGLEPHTILVSSQKAISQDTTLDGVQPGRIALSGGNLTQVFAVELGASLTLQNITITEGNAGDGSGGAIYNQGALLLIGSQVLNSHGGSDANGGGIFNVGGSVTLNESALMGNTAGYGGGLAGDGGSVTLVQSAIINNAAIMGGGLYVSGVVSITHSLINSNTANDAGGILSYAQLLQIADSTISDNHAPGGLGDGGYGGGLYNGGPADLNRVTLRGNSANLGGGIYHDAANAGELLIEASTLNDNRAFAFGGAIYGGYGDISLLNVTFSGNSASEGGGALYQYGGNATLTHNTLSYNQALYGAGIYRDAAGGSSVTLARTVLADNVSGNCDGAIISGGYNLADDTHCGFDQTGDQQDVDPLLKGLASNGGPTVTHLPGENSPVIDAAPLDGCPDFDQRGLARPLGRACDSGALETDPDGAILACGGDFAASADTMLEQSYPDSNFGQGNQLRVAKSANGDSYTLLAFDLAGSIPPGSALHSAELELTLFDASNPGPYALTVHEAAAWDEASATWNTAPALGLGYDSPIYETTGDVLHIDVTTLVNRWLTGDAAPTTLAVVPGNDTEVGLTFTSREGVEMPASAPRLVVRCAPVQLPVPADETAADLAQEADANRLGQESGVTPGLQFIGSAVRFGSFQLTVPPEVGTDPLARATWFLDNYRNLLRVDDPAVEFQLIRTSDDGQHLFFRQRHAGIPVFGAELGLHFDGAVLSSVAGAYIPGITLASYPTLTAERAEALALAAGGEGAAVNGDTQLRYISLDLLGIPDGGLHLAWEVHLLGGSLPGANFVDAQTGAVVFTSPTVNEGYDLDLEDGNNDVPQDLCSVWDDDDIDWNDDLPDSGLATDYFHNVYYYWRNILGRDSYDNDGEQMEVNIHVAFNPPNASYGVCDLFFFGQGTLSRDIVGHEFTHAVDNSEGQLQYVNQSGALDESFADIFGYMLDRSNWLIGEGTTMAGAPAAGCGATWALRDLANPQCFNQPVQMSQYVFLPTNNDNGGVHTNSGIHNKAAFLIIAGGSFNTFNVAGMGADKAQHLFNEVLTGRLWSSSQLLDARNAAVADAQQKVAQGFMGFNNTDVCTVRNAYAAVGLGWGDRDCDGQEDNVDPDQDGDGRPDASDNCPILWNPGQADLDRDGIGDACDNDDDGDGRIDSQDNCRSVANPGQADWNSNGAGDSCDDTDSDGTMDNTDNCRTIRNPLQEDQDFDGRGDACDTDRDGDGISNYWDNCPSHWNPFQEDTTEIALGLPADGVGDTCDLCPAVSNSDNRDIDRDGLADPCDDDDDGDGFLDGSDNCPEVHNPSQLDWDNNGIGFACDRGEQESFGRILRDYHTYYTRVDYFKVPVPICLQCGIEYLPTRYEVLINVQLPVGFKAQVVDSSGTVVAKGVGTAFAQTLRISPLSFAVTQLGGLGTQHMNDGANDLPLTEFDPDEMRYYLQIEAVPGTDLSQPYPLTLKIEGQNGGSTIYLPMVISGP